MTKFWRLFTSAYVQEFVDSISMPTSDELVGIFIGNNFDEVLKSNQQTLINLFAQVPTFKEIFETIKKATMAQLEKNQQTFLS